MAGEWREATVGEIAAPVRNALVGGPFGSNLVSRDYVDAGVPVIRGQNMGSRWVSGEFAFVTTAKAESLDANLARAGDIVFTQRGTLGQVSVVPKGEFDRYLVSQSQMKLTVNHALADPMFIYYVFTAAEQQDYIRQNSIQTGVPHTNLGILRSTVVQLPPLSEQRAVARILGALDDKIELNRRMNETLEATARALFKSWFVDFDPVRATAEGRDPGLPQPLTDLFPESFDDTPSGVVPRSWKLRPLGGLVELTRGKTYKSGLKGHPGPVLLGLASIARDGGFRDDGLATYGGDSPANLVLGPGDLFVSLKDVTQSGDLLGAVARVPAHVKKGRLTQDTVKLTLRSPDISPHILYQTLLTRNYRDYCRSHATGTTNLGLSREDFLAFPVVQPTREIQRAFDSALDHLEARRSSAEAESRSLSAVRDALLPKLISGELRATNAGRLVEGLA